MTEVSAAENVSIMSSYIENSKALEREIELFITNADYENQTDLCSIMSKYGSDKGGIGEWHNYTTLYSRLFCRVKNKAVNIFELGLGTNDITIPANMGVDGKPGASLYGWEEYFPRGRIFGADIDKKILFNTDRIKTYYCDQLNKTLISEMWSNSSLNNMYFDIIIEDGLHSFESNLTFLENSLCKLKKGGFFIIEDLSQQTVDSFTGIKESLVRKFNLQCLHILPIPTEQPYDNTLIIILK